MCEIACDNEQICSHSRYEVHPREKEQMSILSFLPRRGKGLLRITFAMMVGVLLVLQGLLPSVAFARSQGQTIALSSSPTQAQDFVRDEAGVSVVRLIASYGTQSVNTEVVCTGLGVLIASSPESATASPVYRNWVLTDAGLFNSNTSTCGKGQTTGNFPLTTLKLLASDEYTNKTQRLSALGQLNCVVQKNSPDCTDNALQPVSETFLASDQGYTLFSFQSTAWQPYLTLNFGTTPAPAAFVGLTDSSGQIFPHARISTSAGSPTTSSPLAYLAPQALSPTISGGINPANASTNEGGTPLVDKSGNLIKMYLSNGVILDLSSIKATAQGLNIPFSSTTAPNNLNPLKTNWDQGITAYYNQQYLQADTAFKKIFPLNSSFAAAQSFDEKANLNLHATNAPQSTAPSGISLSLPLIVILIVGLLLLAALVILAVFLIVRARTRQVELRRFADEQQEAQRFAENEMLRQRAHQAQQSQPMPAIAFACPNCHQPVHLADSMCPYCRFPLSPSASGLNIQLAGKDPMPPALVGVNTIAPPPPPISEQPTMLFAPNQENQSASEDERTARRQNAEAATYHIQQAGNNNLSLAVGTLSDPGIKRKHKPNEDSLFAMQGSRTHNSQPQQFGLFVVADGMGGHANGQDASRLAIQTMIDFMLPRISSSEHMDDDTFQKLLGSGVQSANQAVHAHNVEIHADMGTTMTAALVVGATAYVGNVGDSRTYLYRESLGLQKVTNDHSVVASLVLAGIIQPDDIYTHPKRNQIYRSLGEKPLVEVDIFKVTLQPGDKLLLCSDGLWDMVRDPLIQEVLSKPTSDPNKTGQSLIKAALEGGGEDNVTVIVAQFGEMNEQTGLTGVQLLAKPETVTIPNLPLQQ
jgi:serine/threonine protein phosphatase PrpC